ncbi:PREDICTED: pentatricopeptide repeat-containing protein At1g03100, mitochondrial-like [Tarenaya hassleriana]|uniref:pentatricopeptide repeat-containing protein At1g03100, mitochondrial-like n=1 Tax=Tarenaya hassleriana TaxID=28532 RepID=UPI0008FCE337|nr:PREDICTED: pentatricopeptide repeat-containing protein At1g03100, mitochondrial-like [Tarenaya hassleriana]
MLSWRIAKIRAVSVCPSRFYCLFRGVSGDAAPSEVDLGYSLMGKIIVSHARRNLIVLSGNSSRVRFESRYSHKAESFSTVAGSILVQPKDPAKLNEEIQIAVDERRCDDAWRLLELYMQTEGYPPKSVVNNVLVCFAESLDSSWLEKAYGLVERFFEESKQNLLEKEPLIYLSLALAKSAMVVPASTILRKLVKTEQFPHVNAWSAVSAFMSLTGPGAYLSTELVLEIGYLFQNNRINPRNKSNAPLLAMKPNTFAFNTALAGCLLSGTTRKAEQLLDMMPRIGVKADLKLLIAMARLYERNGQREELGKLQRYIDDACNLNESQFWQFHNCLFLWHLKSGDLDSASRLILEMLRKGKMARNSLGTAILGLDTVNGRSNPGKVAGEGTKVPDGLKSRAFSTNSMISYEEFSRDRNFLKLEAEAKDVLCSLLAKLHLQVELITPEYGTLQPSEGIFVKLAKAYLQSGKIKDLAEFLKKAEREDAPVSSENSMLINIINSCISLGKLDQAHDLLNEMRMTGARTGASVYSSLMKAYCKTDRTREVTSLLRDAQKAGIQLDSSCYEALAQSRVIQKDNLGALSLFKEMKEQNSPREGNQQFERLLKGCEGNAEAGLMSKLLREIREVQSLETAVHDWNNVIHFFSKKGLMQDAEKALRKMRNLGHSPNAQTFHAMVTGYAAIGGKYKEVTELWGEMKSKAASMKFDQELLDSVLYTFVRGGFFASANEVVEMMEKGDAFVDKYKYRSLFLKYHKTLYKGKAPKIKTEAKVKRRGAALAFKKWVGLS